MRVERPCEPMSNHSMMYGKPEPCEWWERAMRTACGMPPPLAERIKLMSDIERTTVKCQVFLSNFFRKR